MEHDDIIAMLVRIETKLDDHLKLHEIRRTERYNFWTNAIVPGLVSIGTALLTLTWRHK